MAVPCFFDYETVEGTDCNHLLHDYIHAQAPNFPSNALFQKDGAPPNKIVKMVLLPVKFTPTFDLKLFHIQLVP